MHTKFQTGNQRGRNHLNGRIVAVQIGCEDFDQVHLAQVKVQFKAVVIMVQVTHKNWNF